MKKVTYEEVTGVLDKIIQEAGQALLEVEFVVGVSRGGLFPAMVVSTTLMKPLVVAYIDKQDHVYFDRGAWIRGKKVLLVDDIVRTGKTIAKIKMLLLRAGALSVATLTVYSMEAVAECFAPDHGRITRGDITFPWDES
jgi:hypoxanthine phosphoribosyltransferase